MSESFENSLQETSENGIPLIESVRNSDIAFWLGVHCFEFKILRLLSIDDLEI